MPRPSPEDEEDGAFQPDDSRTSSVGGDQAIGSAMRPMKVPRTMGSHNTVVRPNHRRPTESAAGRTEKSKKNVMDQRFDPGQDSKGGKVTPLSIGNPPSPAGFEEVKVDADVPIVSGGQGPTDGTDWVKISKEDTEKGEPKQLSGYKSSPSELETVKVDARMDHRPEGKGMHPVSGAPKEVTTEASADKRNVQQMDWKDLWRQVKFLVGDVAPLDESITAKIKTDLENTSNSTNRERLASNDSRSAQKSFGETHDKENIADDVEMAEANGNVVLKESTAEPMEYELISVELPSDAEHFLKPVERKDNDLTPYDEIMGDAENERFDDLSDDEAETANSPASAKKRVDITLLASILQDSKEAINNIGPDTDVILLLGRTGVGKSTLLQALAGHKLKVGWDSSLNRWSYVVDGTGEEGFDIGHGMVSQTRHVRTYFKKNGESSVCYVDTSGFGDSEGVEYDIATSICVREIAMRCHRIRFVVLINAVTFHTDRAGELFSSLSLITNFVGHRFNSLRKCFTFLFTHCNKAFDAVPSNVEEATDQAEVAQQMRDELSHLLKSVKKENSDTRMKSLSDFLRASLQKGFPYCDIFDPLASDMDRIFDYVEPRNSRWLGDTGLVQCSLTSTSSLQLSRELSSRLEDISSSLESTTYGDNLKLDVRTVFTLAGHVDGSVCQEPARAALTMLRRQSTLIKNRISEVACSTLLDSERSSHNSNDPEAVWSDIQRLCFLQELILDSRSLLGGEAPNHGTQLQNDVLRALLALLDGQKNVIEGEISRVVTYVVSGKLDEDTVGPAAQPSDLRRISIKLQQLKKWAQAFASDEFCDVYRQAWLTVHQSFACITHGILDAGEPPVTNAPKVLRSMSVLHQVKTHGLTDLLVFGTPTESNGDDEICQKILASARSTAVMVLAKVDRKVRKAVAKAFGGGLSLDDDRMVFNDLEKVMCEVDTIHGLIENEGLHRELGGCQPRREALETALVSFIQHQELCVRLTKTLDSRKASLLEMCVRSLEGFSNSLPPSMCCEGQFTQALHKLYRLLAAELNRLCERLHLSVRQLNTVSFGVEPHVQKAWLDTLRSSIWFDSVISDALSEQAFVCKVIDGIQAEYSDYARGLMDQMARTLAGMIDTGSSPTPGSDMKTLVDASKTLELVSFIIDSDYHIQFTFGFRRSVKKWCAHQLDEMCFPSEIHDLQFHAIGSALLTAKILLTIDEESDREISILGDNILKHLTAYRENVEATVQSNGNFEAKGEVLGAASKWSRHQILLEYLPSYSKLSQYVRTDVENRAEKVHKLVTEAGEIELSFIEAEIEYLLEATKHIDSYVDHVASKWTNILIRLLESRKDEIDGNFLGMIDDNNFSGIAAFLAPMPRSRDERSQNRYRACLKVLSTHLWQKTEALRLIIRDPRGSNGYSTKDVKFKLQSLEQAETEIVPFAATMPPPTEGGTPWSLSEENGVTAVLIESALEESLEATSEALKSIDFLVAVESSRHAAMMHLLRGDSFLSEERVHRMQANVAALLSDVRRDVKAFLESLHMARTSSGDKRHRPTSSFPPDTTSLRRSLGQLKNAAGQADCPTDILDLYTTAHRKLSRGLNELYRFLSAEAAEGKFSCALEILGFLRQELVTRGLKEHVDLEFDVVAVVSDLVGQKEKRDRDVNLGDEREIEQLAKQLDSFSLFTGWNRADYKERRRRMRDFVRVVVLEALDMIKNNEFSGLRGKFAVVVRIKKQLGRHLRAREDIYEEVKDALALRTVQVLHDMESSLENHNMDHFQVLFSAFHGLLEDVTVHASRAPWHRGASGGALSEFDSICKTMQHNVHRCLLHQAQTKLKAFDDSIGRHQYEDAASKEQKLRGLGLFFTSGFELYRENVCGSLVSDDLSQIIALVHSRFASGRLLVIGLQMAVLRLAPTAHVSTVKKAYQTQILLWHPDKNPGNKNRAEEKSKAINRAKDILLADDGSALEFYQHHDFLFLTEAIGKISQAFRAGAENAIESQEFDQAASICSRINEVPALLAVLRNEANTSLISTKKIRVDIFNAVRAKANALRVEIQKAWDKQDFVELHHRFSDLESLERGFKSHKEVVPDSFTSIILRELNANLKTLQANLIDLRGQDELVANREMKKFGVQLIEIGRILDGFPRLKKDARAVIFSILNDCYDQPWGVSFIFKLGLSFDNGELSEDEDDIRVGRVLVSSFPQFEHVRIVAFTREVITAPVSESIDGLETKSFDGKNIRVDRRALLKEHDKYEKLFHSHFDKFVQQGHDELVQHVFKLVTELGPCDVTNWTGTVKAAITQVVAGVFATFTIIKSGDTFKSFQEHDNGNTSVSVTELLFRPHNVQVLAILRLLGIGDTRKSLASHIMEIRTGEGKSLILGALSVTLALLGFSVRCVCYSEHLSERDNELFRDIFVAFGVQDRIAYSKINTMSEDAVASKGDIREMTTSLVNGEGLSKKSEVRERRAKAPRSSSDVPSSVAESALARYSENISEDLPELTGSVSSEEELAPLPMNGSEILIVDEVDVFFGPDFYGQTYNQIAQLEDPTIEKLLRKIWESRKDKPSFTSLKRWTEYRNVLNKYKNWPLQIETEVRSMCYDVGSFNEPQYEVDSVNSRIGYSKMDSVDWNLVYGYRTAFAYLHEFERGRLKGPSAEASVKRALCLRISCGQFSYAHISPAKILGVSGTLKALSAGEKQIVRGFGIEMYSFVPSVYGKNNLTFNKAGRGVVIVKEKKDHLREIANEINGAVNAGRAALVFFENEERLQEFRQSPYWRGIRNGNMLSSTTNKETRNYVIKRAATSGQVTIATAAFGRGTDFFCKDDKLEKAEGLLVIQTFLSVEKSEEVQIQGRTARQGKKGSYMLLLREGDLCELLDIKPGAYESKPHEELYEWLDTLRSKVHDTKLSETSELVEQAEERDRASRDYLDALVHGKVREAKHFLDVIYEGIKSRSRKLNYCRMVCLSDATGSMESIWSATRSHIGEMLRRIDEIGEGQFELMWVAYRDYSDGSGLLEKSSWTRNPGDLEDFLSRMKCYGGGDEPEAVEMALREVNIEHGKEPVTRALLIGDAEPHLESRGAVLKSHDNHVMSTDFRREAKDLGRNGIPAYTFRLNDFSDVVKSFSQIAELSGGESHKLDFSSSDGAQKLIDCVCITALEDIGGTDLVEEYVNRKWD